MSELETFETVLRMMWARPKATDSASVYRVVVGFRIAKDRGIPMSWWRSIDRYVVQWGEKR